MSKTLAAYKPRTRWLGAALIALLAWAVVVATAGTARAADGDITIKVRVGADRTDANTVGPAVGATVTLYDQSLKTVVRTAVAGADGVATFTLPKGSGNSSSFYSAIVTDAPGSTPVDPKTFPWESVRYNVHSVKDGKSYSATTDLATVRNNPPLSPNCGLKVALIVDVSGSVVGSLDQLRAASTAYVNALEGTPSQIQIITFGQDAQMLSDLTSVSTKAGADTLRSKINTITKTRNTTNWNDAMWLAAQQPGAFDLAVVITDGEPTTGESASTDYLSAGIFSANALKAEGTTIVALGVGQGVTGHNSESAARTLAAISGPRAGVDFHQKATYDDVALSLRDMAFASCSSSLTVVKQVIPAGGDKTDAAPAGGFTFDATSTGAVTTTPSGTTADATGAVNFSLEFANNGSGTVTVTEKQKDGYTLAPDNGANAVCTVKNPANPTGTSRTVTNAGALGFAVSVDSGDMVSCVVTNQAGDDAVVPPAPTDTATSTTTPTATSTTTPSAAPPAAKTPLAETGGNAGLIVALVAVLLAAGGTLAVVARRRITARR